MYYRYYFKEKDDLELSSAEYGKKRQSLPISKNGSMNIHLSVFSSNNIFRICMYIIFCDSPKCQANFSVTGNWSPL